MIHQFAGALLSPLLIVQGLITRMRTPRLPEADGPRAGSSGKGRHLRVLILGDSAAAGVGVAEQQDALSGQLVTELSRSARVDWQLQASTGHRTKDALRTVREMPARQYDVVVISLGVNDVTGLVSCKQWRESQCELRTQLASRFRGPLIVSCGLPPMHLFPALPQPLRWFLGRRAALFSEVLRQDIAPLPGTFFLDLQFLAGAEAIAADGFHPGAIAYSVWAKALSELLHPELNLPLPAGTGPARAVECAASAAQD